MSAPSDRAKRKVPQDKRDTTIRVTALCGGLRSESITRTAVRVSLEGARREGAKVEMLDPRDYDMVRQKTRHPTS